MTTFLLALLAIVCTATEALYINISILESATAQGAVCLDGTPPAYHLDKGFDSGLSNWLIVIDGGGWCDTITSCKENTMKELGSSKQMKQQAEFDGILHNKPEFNPDFYNWNRVKVKYCDGSSLTGDVEHVDLENKLFFRGARIFKAIVEDLLMKGMKDATNAILSGSSAGGLATILNCDKFKSFFSDSTRVKCIPDAGFFINGKSVYGTSEIQDVYNRVVSLHGSAKNLPASCTSIMEPSLCFFPENVISNIQTPIFVINSEFDTWQISNSLVPNSEDVWGDCKYNFTACTFSQRLLIQGFGLEFLKVFTRSVAPSFTRGYFITSCYTHGRNMVKTHYWISVNSRRIFNKTIAEAVGDWFFERGWIHHYIDPYPLVRDCHVDFN